MVLLYFVVTAIIILMILGNAVTPRSKKKPLYRWQLDDYGANLVRGLRVFSDAGARNRWRMEMMQNQADYSEKGRMDGDRLPTDHAPHPREQMPPGAIPPHLRGPEGHPKYRPDDWLGADGTESDEPDDGVTRSA